jgi:release factor glutamine methyltransferase
MIQAVFKRVIHHTYKPLLEYYLSSERDYIYRGIQIKVFPGVFHPGFFFSTNVLLKFLEQFEFNNKTLLELGAGSGLISTWAAKQSAIAFASDISQKAIENIQLNKQLNKVPIQTFHSNLFDKIPNQQFDYIVVNPPYYKKEIVTEPDYAWYAGDQLQYFQKLFSQIKSYMNSTSHTFMILISDCDIEEIQKLAGANKIEMKIVFTKKNLLETAFIYRLN